MKKIFFKTDAIRKLNDIFQECQFNNWDCYGAQRISSETLAIAKSFLQEVPFGAVHPDVGAESDGAITFEWYKSKEKVFSISFNDDLTLSYAALLNGNKICGNAASSNYYDFPEELEKLLTKFMGL